MLWSEFRSIQPVSSSGASKGKWLYFPAWTMRTLFVITMPGSSGTSCPLWECWATATARSLRARPTNIPRHATRRGASMSSACLTMWRTSPRLRPCQALWSGPPPSRGHPVPSAAGTSRVMKMKMIMRMMYLVLRFCKFLKKNFLRIFFWQNFYTFQMFPARFFLFVCFHSDRQTATRGVTSFLTMGMTAQTTYQKSEHFLHVYLFIFITVMV